ncbi:MAG: hypothetical protein K2M76_00255 [Muribaculaceae bacterium]|nr:hypothetical protein [Muribaculaceae bacterium]
MLAVTCGCIEDGIVTSPQAQPAFSADTLRMGLQFTCEPSATYSLKIYNRYDKILNLSDVRMESGEYFRINVDGFSGTVFSNVEIRPNDSIYVFVETTLPDNGGLAEAVTVRDRLLVQTNGVESAVVIEAEARDVDRRYGEVLTGDTRFTAELPYQIFDSLVVAPGATLMLEAGTTLYFHAGAEMRVYGSLVSCGTSDKPVTLRGDRRGQMVGKIDYEIMSNQWSGLLFMPGSTGNRMAYTSVENTAIGVWVIESDLWLESSRLHNSAGNVLTALAGDVTALGCQLSNAAGSVVEMHGGNHLFNRCTIVNYYLFSAPQGAIFNLRHLGPDFNDDDFQDVPYTTARVTNSIIAGRGPTMSKGDFTGYDVRFERCLMLDEGSDDSNFVDCLWEADPKLDYDLVWYTFDYSPAADGDGVDAAFPALDHPALPRVDMHGRERGMELGCYAPAPADDEAK